LNKPDPPSKHSLAREYGVAEVAVWKVWQQKDEIEQHSRVISAEIRALTFNQRVTLKMMTMRKAYQHKSIRTVNKF